MKFSVVSALSNQGYPGILLKDIEGENLPEVVLEALKRWKEIYSTETLFFSGDQLIISLEEKRRQAGIANHLGEILVERDWRS